MIDNDKAGGATPRRIHPIRLALKPVQDLIGQLNEAAVYLDARVRRYPDYAALAEELSSRRRLLAETLALYEQALVGLPEKYHHDTRLADTRAAITRLSFAFEAVQDDLARRFAAK